MSHIFAVGDGLHWLIRLGRYSVHVVIHFDDQLMRVVVDMDIFRIYCDLISKQLCNLFQRYAFRLGNHEKGRNSSKARDNDENEVELPSNIPESLAVKLASTRANTT
jgi:hypothetical protein